MGLPLYRAIVKVACGDCALAIRQSQRIDVRCPHCRFVKYTQINNLKRFTSFLHQEYPEWTWFNVYEYVKGKPGRKLATFQKGKNEPLDGSL